MKMSDAYTMVVPDVSGRIRLLKNPTYVGDDYYSGTDISDDCVYHIRANDGFIYEGSAVNFPTRLKTIRWVQSQHCFTTSNTRT